MDTKKAALFGLLGLALGFVLGYGSGRVSTGTPLNPIAPGAGRTDLADVERRLNESGVLPPAPTETEALSGAAVSVDGMRLTFDADLQGFDPLGSRGLQVRRVAETDASTIIVLLEEKSPEELEAEQAAFAAAAGDETAPPPAPPSPYKEVPITLAEIVPGDSVIVQSDADILTASTFKAVRVTVARQATAAAPDQVLPPPAP